MAKLSKVIKTHLNQVFTDSQDKNKCQKCVTEYMRLFRELSDGESFQPFITATGQWIISALKFQLCSFFNTSTTNTKQTIAVIAQILSAVAQCEEAHAMPNVMQVDDVNNYQVTDDELGTVDFIIENYLAPLLIASDTRENAISLIQKLLEAIETICLRNLILIVEALDICATDTKLSIRHASLASLRFIHNLPKGALLSNKLQSQLKDDPEKSVRFSELMHLEVNCRTLDAIVFATQDVEQSIRQLAYIRIASATKVTDFHPSTRILLLSNAMLNDRKCANANSLPTLINGWLSKLKNANLVTFLKYLNIQENGDTIEKILYAYFHHLVHSKKEGHLCTPFQIRVKAFKRRYWDKPALTQEALFLGRLIDQFTSNKLPFKVEPLRGLESWPVNGLLANLAPLVTLFMFWCAILCLIGTVAVDIYNSI